MVGRPTDHSATIKAIAKKATEAFIEYGAVSGTYTGTTNSTVYSDGIIEAVVDDLSPDTRYYYRLQYRDADSTAEFLTGDEYTFHTKRAKTSTFTFAIQSDSHLGVPETDGLTYNDPDLYRLTMKNIVSANPDCYTVAPFTNRLWYPRATIIENTGHLRVTVTPTNATIEYVRSYLSAEDGENNSVAESYTVEGYTP